MQAIFMHLLPQTWATALAEAVMAEPAGFVHGATVITNKLASPTNVPAITLVGDAAHATSWRLGYSLQAAVGSAVALGSALRAADSLSDALQNYSDTRTEPMSALANMDRLVRFLLHVDMHQHS